MTDERSQIYDVILEPSEDGGYTVHVPAAARLRVAR